MAVMTRVPGTPGRVRSAMSTTQLTVAVTEAGVPAGVSNPDVSTRTCWLAQRSCWSCRLRVAAARASRLAALWLRAIEADRADSAAADSTTWRAIAYRPAQMINGDEQHERRHDDHRLDRRRPPLPAASLNSGHGPVIRSTGADADCSTRNLMPGITDSAVPRTVTVTVVAVRRPVTVVPVSTSPPFGLGEAGGGGDPVAGAGVLGGGGGGALLRGGERDRAGVVPDRGLDADEHGGEQQRQQHHQLHRRRPPLIPAGHGSCTFRSRLELADLAADVGGDRGDGDGDDADDRGRPGDRLDGDRAALVALRLGRSSRRAAAAPSR